VRDIDDMISTNLIVRHKGGSHAYGTNIETSDIDIRGIFCADAVNILTPFYKVEHKVEQKVVLDKDIDITMYELCRFVELYTAGNPNILETLWIDQVDILESTTEYGILRAVRQNLLSSKVAFTFTGYASAQASKLKSRSKNVSYEEDLQMLINILQQGLQDKLIDLEFIERECGDIVLQYLLNKKLI
jgi:predicted nucleotidyltransferase